MSDRRLEAEQGKEGEIGSRVTRECGQSGGGGGKSEQRMARERAGGRGEKLVIIPVLIHHSAVRPPFERSQQQQQQQAWHLKPGTAALCVGPGEGSLASCDESIAVAKNEASGFTDNSTASSFSSKLNCVSRQAEPSQAKSPPPPLSPSFGS